MQFVLQQSGKIVLSNDTKHDRVRKLVTEINDNVKNFPNAPRPSPITWFLLVLIYEFKFFSKIVITLNA